MSTVIRASERNQETQLIAFNFEDISERSERYLAQVRVEALKIVAKYQEEAQVIRRQAEEEGRQAGLQAVEDMVKKQLAAVIPALRQAIEEIQVAKQSWLRHWESSAVKVSGAIAEKLVRREISKHPEITLDLVREALELAAGNAHVRIRLNPNDIKAMGNQIQMLVDEIVPLSQTVFEADADISSGGCRLETQFGAIDQRFEAQLKRIEEELTQ